MIADNVIEELARTLQPAGWLLLIGSRFLDPIDEPNVIAIKALDEHWWDIFARAAAGCQALFVFPEISEALNRELVEISRLHGQNKTIVVMSPPTGRDDRKGRWDEVRSQFLEHGWTLPDYRNDGLIYLADETLAPRVGFPVKRDGVKNLRKGVEEILPYLGRREPISNLVNEIVRVEEFRRAKQLNLWRPRTQLQLIKRAFHQLSKRLRDRGN